MASLAIAAAGVSGHVVKLPLQAHSSFRGGRAQSTIRWRARPALMSHLVARIDQVVCEDWRLAASLTPAYVSSDDDEDDEDDDEYYVQYKHHLQTVVEAALKNLDGQCVFLTGMMGSGKSTIGDIVAQHLHYGFVDSDKLVEKLTGYDSVADIFAEIGEKGFRDAESQALHWLCEGIAKLRRPVVVALGGGAVMKPENWIMAEYGIVIFIDVSSDILAKRIVSAGIQSRPLFPPECTESLAQALLNDLYNEREDAYRMARIRVPVRDLSAKLGLSDASAIPPDMVAFEVLKRIGKLGDHKET